MPISGTRIMVIWQCGVSMSRKMEIEPPSVPKRRLIRVRNVAIRRGSPTWIWIDRYQPEKHYEKGFFTGRMKAKSKIQRFALLFVGLWFMMPIPVVLLEYLISHQSIVQKEPLSILFLLPFVTIGFFCLLNYVNNLRLNINEEDE